jgi:phosphatidate cytidylyltransferase
VTIVLLALPTAYMALAFGVLWFGAAWEWAGLAGLGPELRFAYAAVMAGVMGLIWQFDLYSSTAVLTGAAIFWAAALVAVLNFPLRLPAPLVALCGLPALVPAWAALVSLHAAGGSGPILALTVLAIVWGADVGAYFVGRALGRRRLAPSVSPAKTWEGVAGGIAAALLIAVLAALWLEQPRFWLLLAAAAALTSVVGDLTASMLKRARGLKDSGRLLPGHGGILDRIDGLTAAVPILTLGLKLAGSLD